MNLNERPEGATHYQPETHILSKRWFDFSAPGAARVFYPNSWRPTNVTLESEPASRFVVLPWDGKSPLQAGMACEYSLTNGGVWHECTIKYVLANGKQFVADCAGNPEGDAVLHVNTCMFRPLGMIEQAAPEQLKLGAMTKEALTALVEAVAKAVEAGKAAADAAPDDGGTANLDRVYLYDLKGWKVEAMKAAGIDCWKSGPGEFHLSAPFDGQGNRRYAGVQAMYKSLKAAGVACSVYYCMD